MGSIFGGYLLATALFSPGMLWGVDVGGTLTVSLQHRHLESMRMKTFCLNYLNIKYLNLDSDLRYLPSVYNVPGRPMASRLYIRKRKSRRGGGGMHMAPLSRFK